MSHVIHDLSLYCMSVITHPTEEVGTITEIFPYEDPRDNSENYAHLVNPPMNLHIWEIGMSTQDMVDRARLLGTERKALCGHLFTPKYNPDKLPVCEPCMKIAQQLMSAEGE